MIQPRSAVTLNVAKLEGTGRQSVFEPKALSSRHSPLEIDLRCIAERVNAAVLVTRCIPLGDRCGVADQEALGNSRKHGYQKGRMAL
jgi:hypothetical protein